jgi:hypothetical protein
VQQLTTGELVHGGSCDFLIHLFSVSHHGSLCFMRALSVLGTVLLFFIRDMGDKLLEQRVSIECSVQFEKKYK